MIDEYLSHKEIKKTINDDVSKKKDQFEWDYLVSKLNVDGVTSNLLLNLEFIKKVDNVIEFNLQEEIKDILTEKSKLKLLLLMIIQKMKILIE